MAIFYTGEVNKFDESLNDIIEAETCDKYTSDDLFENASFIVAESENNYNSIMKAMGIGELRYYAENGTEPIYEAADFKAFFTKIKEFFKKIWEKIKSLFQKFFATINSFALSDKEFVKKYKKQLTMVKTKDFTYKGYKFTNMEKSAFSVGTAKTKLEASVNDIDSLQSLDAKELEKEAAEISDDKLTDLLDKTRGASVGQNSVDSSDYSSELFMYFRNGEKSKDTLDDSDIRITELLNIIEGTSKNKKTAEHDFKEYRALMNKLIKAYDNAEKKPLKETPSTEKSSALIKAYTAHSNLQKSVLDIHTLWSGAHLKAMKDRNRQAKSICVKLLTYKPKNESVDYEYSDSSSLSSALGSVEFK